MKCPICGKNVELRNKQVGIDEQGNPVFNQYAICKDCKKQWNLDKKRTQKTTAKKVTEKQDHTNTTEKATIPAKQDSTKKVIRKPAAKSVTEKAEIPAQEKKTAPTKQNPTQNKPVKQNSAKKVVRKPVAKTAVQKTEADIQAPIKKAAPTKQDSAKKVVRKPVAKTAAQKTDADIQTPVKKAAPTKQDPTKKVVRKSDAKTVASKTDADVQTPVKKAAPTKKAVKSDVAKKENTNRKSIAKKFDDTIIFESEKQKLGNIPSEKVRSKKEQRVKQGYAEMLAVDPKSTEHKNPKAKKVEKQPVHKEETLEDNYNDYEPIVRFRALRVIFGIISILIAAFYAFNSYSSGLLESVTGMTFLILAGCMGLAGLLLIILNATNNIFAFLLPMILYLASGLYAFLNRGDDTFLLYSAIIGAAFSVLFIILAISSRGDEEDYEDFDDEDSDDDDDWDDEENDWDDEDDVDEDVDDDDDWDDDDDF